MPSAPRPVTHISISSISAIRFDTWQTASARQRTIRIVAMGSSSTAGKGDVVPLSVRLEMMLRSYGFEAEIATQ